MSRPELDPSARRPPGHEPSRRPGSGSTIGSYPRRYGRYVGLLGLAILALLAINGALTKTGGAKGIEPGRVVPPFAAPLASGNLNGDVNVARGKDEGAAGRVPACEVRGPGVLNVCEQYGRGPLVLALFVDGGSCAAVLDEMQSLANSFPGVGFAAVAIKGERSSLRKLIAKQGLTNVLVGFDSDGILAGLYEVASCPQVSFVLPGGVVQSPALLRTPSRGQLRARVRALVIAAEAKGWRRPS
jgi:hypothetical protein